MSLSALVTLTQFIVSHAGSMSLSELVRWTSVLNKLAHITSF